MYRFLDYFSLAISITFVGLGFFVIFSTGLSYIPINYRIVFGAILIAYGTFRTVMTILKLRSVNDQNEEE